jgi:hypothetical protein
VDARKIGCGSAGRPLTVCAGQSAPRRTPGGGWDSLNPPRAAESCPIGTRNRCFLAPSFPRLRTFLSAPLRRPHRSQTGAARARLPRHRSAWRARFAAARAARCSALPARRHSSPTLVAACTRLGGRRTRRGVWGRAALPHGMQAATRRGATRLGTERIGVGKRQPPAASAAHGSLMPQALQAVAMKTPTQSLLLVSLLCACVVQPALGAPTSCYVDSGAAMPVTMASLGQAMPAGSNVCVRYCFTCSVGDTACTNAQIASSAVLSSYSVVDSATASQMAAVPAMYINLYSCATTNCNTYVANCSASVGGAAGRRRGRGALRCLAPGAAHRRHAACGAHGHRPAVRRAAAGGAATNEVWKQVRRLRDFATRRPLARACAGRAGARNRMSSDKLFGKASGLRLRSTCCLVVAASPPLAAVGGAAPRGAAVERDGAYA